MQFTTGQVANITTTQTLIYQAAIGDGTADALSIENTSSVTFWIGDANVTTTNGKRILAGATINNLLIGDGEKVYGITATGTATCDYIANR